MSSSSSAKKVRKAAKAGGSGPRTGTERKLGFPLAIAAICLVGVAVVAVSRGELQDSVQERPTTDDHWHAAYAIYDCDDWVTTPLADQEPDSTGMHTHEDFLVHMHPFTSRVTGSNARLDRWGDLVGLDLSDEQLEVDSNGVELTREAGEACGDDEGIIQLRVWSTSDEFGIRLTDDDGQPLAVEDVEPVTITEDVGSYRPLDRDVIAIAFAPEGAEIELPPSSIRIEDPTAAEEARTPEPIEGFDQPGPDAIFPVESGDEAGDGEGAGEGDGDSNSPTTEGGGGSNETGG